MRIWKIVLKTLSSLCFHEDEWICFSGFEKEMGL